MPRTSLRNWLKSPTRRRQTTSASAGSRSPQLRAEQLEDRTVPAVLELTTVGASGSINGAVFQQFGTEVAGTGLINSFLRLQATDTEQGYNTDIRPVQFDEKTAANFTRSLLLSDVPTVTVNGTVYREFVLDINEASSRALLSLDQLQIFISTSDSIGGTAYNTTTGQLAGATEVYDLDAGADNWIVLNYDLASGSGRTDMIALIPNAAFAAAGAQYVYLYSQFGTNEASDAGFEEWAVGTTGTTGVGGTIVTPGSLLGSGGAVLNPSVDQPGTISGQKFNDLDGDGTQDEGEPGLAAWTIFLDADGDNVLDAAEQRTTTDADGNFTFTGLAPGTYRVREVQQAGFVQTTCNPADITVCADGDVGGVLFGNFQMISISGTKFRDANGNGVRDAGERGLVNWVIFLDTNDNGSLDVGEKRTRTDANGNFRFKCLGPGSYHVREVVQLGWVRMTDNPPCIEATSGVNVCGVDFGNMPVTAVGRGGGGGGGGGSGGGGGAGGVGAGNAGKLLLTGGNLSSLQNGTFARQVQWVANLYQRVLGEAPDLAGLREYVRLLQAGFTPQRVAAIFIRRHS